MTIDQVNIFRNKPACVVLSAIVIALSVFCLSQVKADEHKPMQQSQQQGKQKKHSHCEWSCLGW